VQRNPISTGGTDNFYDSAEYLFHPLNTYGTAKKTEDTDRTHLEDEF
jgi:hypothetical protein